MNVDIRLDLANARIDDLRRQADGERLARLARATGTRWPPTAAAAPPAARHTLPAAGG